MEIQMKTCPAIFSSLALAVCFVISTRAQQQDGTAAASASSLPAGAASLKIAVIEREAFLDPEKGITRLIRAVESLNQEFEPLKKELQDLEQDYRALADEIAVATAATDSGWREKSFVTESMREKGFLAESMRRRLRNKTEDVEQVFEKRLRQVIGLIEDDLQKAIASYAQRRGISLVIDSAKSQEVILYVAGSADVTQDFINEYNRHTSSAAIPLKPPGN